MKQSTNKLNEAVERMTTGYKINHAKDNAANYSISTNMSTKISAYDVAADNVAMGLDMLTTATENLGQIENKLTRLRALATQAQNGTYGGPSKEAINAEANALVDEIGRIYGSNSYNGIDITSSESSSFIKDIARRDTSNMTTLESVDESVLLAEDTYSISSVAELEKLARMTNAGLIGANSEFVLAKDLDLGAISNWTPIGLHTYGSNDFSKSFRGKFDGNGYVISNLKIDSTSDNDVGLFGHANSSEIKNLGIENANVKSTEENTAILIGGGYSLIVDNCYATGFVDGAKHNAGGLCGFLSFSSKASQIKNSYAKADIKGEAHVGGFAGALYRVVVENCFSESRIEATGVAGGFIGISNQQLVLNNCYAKTDFTTARRSGFLGNLQQNSVITLKNCYVDTDSDIAGIFIGTSAAQSVTIDNCQYNKELADKNIDLIRTNNTVGPVEISNISTFTQKRPFEILTKSLVLNEPQKAIELQVGVNSNEYSQINFDTKLILNNISELRYIGLNENDYISLIDDFLIKLSDKQTQLGAAQNRLESAMDEIITQHDNLISARSTLRDADMAELSSQYIQQQILQEASLTLMSADRNLRYQNVIGLLQSLG